MLTKYEGLKAYWKRRNTTHKVIGLWNTQINIFLNKKLISLLFHILYYLRYDHKIFINFYFINFEKVIN